MQVAFPNTSARAATSGFSLFEMLMFIAILGVMIGITVPMFSQHDGIYAARDRRNAQEIASTCTIAQTAGLNFVQEDSVLETIRAIVRGGTPVQGAMKGRRFVVPGLSEEDIQGAAKYLAIKDGTLTYTNARGFRPSGTQSL